MNKQKELGKKIKVLLKRCVSQVKGSNIFWFIVGCIFSLGLVFFSNYLVESDFQSRLRLAEPDISITIKEISDEMIHLEIKSNNVDGSAVTYLYFDFDLPGVLTNISNEYKELIDTCDIYSQSRIRRGVNVTNGTSLRTTCERIFVECKDIMPNGYYGVDIKYNNADKIYEEIWIQNYGNLDYFIYLPLNLRDFIGVNYYWDFGGKTQSNKQCIDLRNESYIQIDNERLVELYKISGWECDIDMWEDKRNPCSENYGSDNLSYLKRIQE